MVRKTVTVLFADVTGSTALGEQLDPEALRRVMTQYYDAARATLERHGGTVEKFIGDAVMAVFGIPQTHEDDALRALRAAVELRDADLGVTLRIGVNTGEVVADEGETLVTGDAVNVAARLEQAAAPGEILVGDTTYRLAHNAVRVEPVEPVTAKGKSEPVPAWLLVEVLDDTPAFTRRIDAPFVGRAHELEQLLAAHERAVETRAAQRVTVLGAAGIGKSRVAAELVQHLGDSVRVVVGRCLAYGEGITYWPLAEIVRESAGLGADAIRRVVGDDLAADRLAAAVGLSGVPGTKEETQWAARRYLEALADKRPLVAVLDDLHWAEQTFLDLVEYVGDFATAPILLLCTARPDLLDVRPAWTAPRPNAVTLVLEPLSSDDAGALLSDVDPETRDRILAAAEGNPLFVEQLVALRSESASGELTVPPTIQALLAARLDALPSSERSVVERASVEGRLFHRGSVAELAPDDVRPDVGAHLLALVRKEFVRPDRAEVPGDDGYRFAHILVRDAAYEAMPKELRADLHERFVEWLERVASARLEQVEEIVAYHLEQAALYRRDVGLDDEGLERRAAERLARAGERAHDRGDLTAAKNLLARAAGLLPRADPERVRLLPLLGATLHSLGEFEGARELLAGAVEEADEAHDPTAATSAWAWDAVVRMQTMPEHDQAATDRELADVLARVDDLTDPRAVMAVRRVELFSWLMKAQWLKVVGASEQLREAALDAGDQTTAAEALHFLGGALAYGPAPAAEVAAAVDRLRVESHGPVEELSVSHLEAVLCSFRGEFERGWETLEFVRARFFEFANPVFAAIVTLFQGAQALEAGDPARAEHVLRQGADELRALGEAGYLSTQLGYLAAALCALDRLEEAESTALEAKSVTQAGDAVSETLWRTTRATVLARRGDHDEAERLAREAVALIERTDSIVHVAAAHEALADVLACAGRGAESRPALERALSLYEQKGHEPLAARARAALAGL